MTDVAENRYIPGFVSRMPDIFGIEGMQKPVGASEAERVAEGVKGSGWEPRDVIWVGNWANEEGDRFGDDARAVIGRLLDDSRLVPGKSGAGVGGMRWSVADLLRGRIPRGSFSMALDEVARTLFEGDTQALASRAGLDELMAARIRRGKALPLHYGEVRKLADAAGLDAAEILKLTWLAEMVPMWSDAIEDQDRPGKERSLELMINSARLMLGGEPSPVFDGFSFGSAVDLVHFAMRGGFHPKTAHVVTADYCLLRLDDVMADYSEYAGEAMHRHRYLNAATASGIASLFMEEKAEDARGALGLAAVYADQAADFLGAANHAGFVDKAAIEDMRDAFYRRAISISGQMPSIAAHDHAHPGFASTVRTKRSGAEVFWDEGSAGYEDVDSGLVDHIAKNMPEHDRDVVRDWVREEPVFWQKLVHSGLQTRIMRTAVRDVRRWMYGEPAAGSLRSQVISPMLFNYRVTKLASLSGIFHTVGLTRPVPPVFSRVKFLR